MIAYIRQSQNPNKPEGMPDNWPWRSMTVQSAADAPLDYDVISEEEYENIIQSLLPQYQAWEQSFNQAQNTNEYVDRVVEATINECDKIKKRFIRENIILGISNRTFNGVELTDHVLEVTERIMAAFATGSTKSAIRRIIELDSADFDGVILNETRILQMRNEIESFHGWPLATSYNQPPTW